MSPLKNKQAVQEKCKFWPECKNGDSCSFYHPTVDCRSFPKCRFGETCRFIHPPCKYDGRCTESRCPYTHKLRSKLQTSPVSSPVSGFMFPSPSVLVPSSPSVPPIPCKFYPSCTKVDCPYYHPQPVVQYSCKEGGKLKFEQNKSNKICYFIDNFNLPVNAKLRLEKDHGPPSGLQVEYRLRPIHSDGTEESPSLMNDAIYFKKLEDEVSLSLKRIKFEMERKRHLKADIWCHFGTVLIRQPDEGPGGEWSTENALSKLLEGTEWKTLFRGGVNLDEKIVEQHLCNQSLPEYEDYQSRYDLTFRTPNGGQLTLKVWVIKENVGKTLESIKKIPSTDVKNILNEVCFEDQFTSSRCRGWLILPPQRYLRADILFPGCEFDCRLTIRALADSGFHMDFVPKDDIRNTLLRYLSKVTFSDEDDFGLRLPDEKLPDGFKLSFMRCSKRAVYRFSKEFSIILSKESTRVYGSDVKKETDFHLHCKEWDELLNRGNWEPVEITKKLPDFFRFVKKVQSSIIHEIKHEGASVPPEIRARGSSATESYFKALAYGTTSIKRVPIMLIGQDGAGKTSLKKSLKGICFDPNEDSTVGINVDPSHFKVTTETWRTGTAGDEQDADAALSFDYHSARWIVDYLKESDERPLIQTSTTEIKTSGDTDETKITRQYVISETEGDAKRDETLVEPATVPNEEALNNSSSPIEHNPKSLSDSTRYIPEEIAVGTETLLKGNFEDNRENIYSCLFDFAGQSVYYVTHQLFLTGRAIYCLAYNLSLNPDDPAKPLMKQGVYEKYQDTFNLKTNLDYLAFWLRSVANTTKTATEAGLPPVFLVCTHADAPYDKNSDPRDLAYKILGRLREKPYGVHLFDVYVVDNTKSGTANECSEVIRLRQEILALAEQLPYINEAIPIKWLKFEKAITALKKQKKGNKCISLKDARDIATNDCNITEKREIRTLLDYLHDLKNIIHFDDTPELKELVVLDPQWLIDVFKKVITVQPAYQCEEKKLLDKWKKLESGLLDEKLLRHMWKSLSDDEETYQSLIAIMEKFSLMCPWPLDASDASGNKSYLVPSMLKSHPPKEITELAASSELPSLFLRFEDGHVPAGLFPRLVLAIFQWGKDEFWETAKLHLFCNFARYFTSTDNDCSIIFVCHSSFIEIVVHNANIGLDSIEDLVRDLKMSYSPGFQRDNTNSNVTFTRAVCSQVGLTLECMRHEFCWLKNMRYEMSVICPVCCHRGGVNFCLAHCKQGCKEEECLHFWPISELRTVKYATFCTRSASAKDIRVPVSQFSHWFPPVSHKVSQSGTGDSYKNFASSSEGNEDKALALPDKLQESLASPSCDPQQIVSLFKEKQPLMEAVSLEKPDPEQMKWIRCLSREANIAKRLDVVQHLRSISPEGTVGPLLSENLDVREIPFEQGRQLTIALSGGDEWKLVAEKLGLNPREIRYLDNRIRNPADAVLGFVAEKRGLTVGELYDVLSNCSLPLLADEL